jgi:UDP:flavonoid glycosyltransferase YjiC (YdhE family)
LMESIRPDLVIGDMRPSLPISARKQEIPCAVMMNAYWSPYAKHRSIIPELPLTRVIPPRWLGSLYRVTEPLVHRVHVGQMNRVRKEFGMGRLPLDLGAMYMDGDYVLYPDIPEFVPTARGPMTHRYMGICEWKPPGAKPVWWDRMLEDPKRKVFIGLGSSGSVRVLPALLRVLSKLPVSVIVATSGREPPAADLATYVGGLLPLPETLRASDAVVSNGGSGVVYSAMAAGTPVLGIPSNADQHLSTAVLEENGAGLGVRVEEASEKCLRHALERLLLDPQYRRSAQNWATIYQRYDSGALFRGFLAEVLHMQQISDT